MIKKTFIIIIIIIILELCKKPYNQLIIGMIVDASLSIDYLITYPSALLMIITQES